MLTSAPNLLTLSRIAIVPVLVVLMLLEGEWNRWAALGLFVLAAVTDFFDGYLARRMEVESDLGRCLDPIADKLLVATVLLVLLGRGEAPMIPALLIILRELTVSGMREFLSSLRIPLPVSRLAKWKTTFQLLGLSCLIVGSAAPVVVPAALIGWLTLWLAALLTVFTGYDYVTTGYHHLVRRPAGSGHGVGHRVEV